MKYCSIAPCIRHGYRGLYCLNHWRDLCPIPSMKVRKNISDTPEWKAWYNMLFRCYSSKAIGYRHYGGRGISVCQRWIDDYKYFLDYMGRKPTPRHSLDRIDVNGNYEPSNCRWATPGEQASNKRPRIKKG